MATWSPEREVPTAAEICVPRREAESRWQGLEQDRRIPTWLTEQVSICTELPPWTSAHPKPLAQGTSSSGKEKGSQLEKCTEGDFLGSDKNYFQPRDTDIRVLAPLGDSMMAFSGSRGMLRSSFQSARREQSPRRASPMWCERSADRFWISFGLSHFVLIR